MDERVTHGMIFVHGAGSWKCSPELCPPAKPRERACEETHSRQRTAGADISWGCDS